MWTDWAAGVLADLGAPLDPVNLDTLWAWSNAESGADVMRWNNPLNTTLPWPGAADSGAQPGAHDVKIYASLTDGVRATVETLLQQGYYPTIVAHLRASVPREQWTDACAQLERWGTGCSWITRYYGAAPGGLEVDMTPEEHNTLSQIYDLLVSGKDGYTDPAGVFHAGSRGLAVQADLDAIKAAVLAIKPVVGTALTPAQAQQLQDARDAIARVEAALKAA